MGWFEEQIEQRKKASDDAFEEAFYIFKEKLSITDGMKDKILIVNGDDKYLKRLDSFKCGICSNNDLIAYNIESFIDKISFNIYLDKEYKIVFNNPGVHFVNDILLAIKACLRPLLCNNSFFTIWQFFSLTAVSEYPKFSFQFFNTLLFDKIIFRRRLKSQLSLGGPKTIYHIHQTLQVFAQYDGGVYLRV